MKSSFPIQSMKNALQERMTRLGIAKEEIIESFARSSGPGGQHVNKTSTAVTLRFGSFTVTAQDSRSQAMNRVFALERLLDAIENARLEQKRLRQSESEKNRRRNRKRPRGLKERILRTKKMRGDIKKGRSRIEA